MPLVADLAEVGFCDAAGLRALLAESARCAECAATLRIVPSDAVTRVIELSGLYEHLSVYPDRHHAVLDGVAVR